MKRLNFTARLSAFIGLTAVALVVFFLAIYTFADQHGLSATTVWRAVKRKVLRPSNALLIEEATGGAVSRMELLYPTANNKGRGADKPKS